MLRSTNKLAALMFVAFMTGCGPAANRPISVSSASLVDAFAEVEFAGRSVKFLTWSGVWQRTDIDAELEFIPDRKVKITRYGDAVAEMFGRYTSVGNLISISVPQEDLVENGGGSGFPNLIMKRDPDGLYLFPDRETDVFRHGTRSAWPLKQRME
jgi:hypothetical protein